MNLTQEERIKFALYLRQEAKTEAGLIEQMKKLNVVEGILESYWQKIDAYNKVAQILESVEIDFVR